MVYAWNAQRKKVINLSSIYLRCRKNLEKACRMVEYRCSICGYAYDPEFGITPSVIELRHPSRSYQMSGYILDRVSGKRAFEME